MERKLILESCLRSGAWGLLEMYVLLTDDIVDLHVRPSGVWDNVDMMREQLAPAVDIKLNYTQHQDLLLLLLRARCPVGNTCGVTFK